MDFFHVIYKIQTVLPRCVVDIVVGGEIVVFQNVFDYISGFV